MQRRDDTTLPRAVSDSGSYCGSAIIPAVAGPIIEWDERYKRAAVLLGFIVAYGVTIGSALR
jgi:hypothetical protein